MKLSRVLVGLGAAGMLLLGSGTSHAQRWDACSARVQKDQQDLERAIDRYGYNSRQAQHEQSELQRDAANCGYDLYDNRSYRSGEDWQYRSPSGGFDGTYDRGYRNYNPAFDNGYRDGSAMGQRDGERNRAFRPSRNDWYEDADRGYNRNYGDKNLYKREYRQGFQQGYSEGYQRWR